MMQAKRKVLPNRTSMVPMAQTPEMQARRKKMLEAAAREKPGFQNKKKKKVLPKEGMAYAGGTPNFDERNGKYKPTTGPINRFKVLRPGQ